MMNAKETQKFSELPEDYRCPVCNSLKSVFVLLTETSSESQEPTTVSDILIRQMAAWGIKYVFGLPGTSSLGVVDAIRKNTYIRYIQVRHEQTAAFMASAYGKLTGNIAACLTIAGPGATNLATGLYDAKLGPFTCTCAYRSGGKAAYRAGFFSGNRPVFIF